MQRRQVLTATLISWLTIYSKLSVSSAFVQQQPIVMVRRCCSSLRSDGLRCKLECGTSCRMRDARRKQKGWIPGRSRKSPIHQLFAKNRIDVNETESTGEDGLSTKRLRSQSVDCTNDTIPRDYNSEGKDNIDEMDRAGGPEMHQNDGLGVSRQDVVKKDPRASSVQNGPQSGWSIWLKEKIFLGIEPTPEILAIMTIYFVEGALGLARLAQTFFLKDQLHLGPAELSALSGIFVLPWTIKPLYGFLSDGFPLFGYKRRSYLVISGLLGCFSYTALGANFWGLLDASSLLTHDSASSGIGEILTSTVGSAFLPSPQASGFFNFGANQAILKGTVVALVTSSACIACSDVVADGIVVERTRDAEDPRVAGGLQSLCWGSSAVGGLISAYFSGSLLEIVGPREVFAITAALPFMVACIALLIDEKPAHDDWKMKAFPNAITKSNAKRETLPETKDSGDAGRFFADATLTSELTRQVGTLWSAIKMPTVWKPSLFLFLWQSTPTSEGAFLYFMTNDLGMGPEFLGRVRLVTSAAGLFGVWAYQKFLRAVSVSFMAAVDKI